MGKVSSAVKHPAKVIHKLKTGALRSQRKRTEENFSSQSELSKNQCALYQTK